MTAPFTTDSVGNRIPPDDVAPIIDLECFQDTVPRELAVTIHDERKFCLEASVYRSEGTYLITGPAYVGSRRANESRTRPQPSTALERTFTTQDNRMGGW